MSFLICSVNALKKLYIFSALIFFLNMMIRTKPNMHTPGVPSTQWCTGLEECARQILQQTLLCLQRWGRGRGTLNSRKQNSSRLRLQPSHQMSTLPLLGTPIGAERRGINPKNKVNK